MPASQRSSAASTARGAAVSGRGATCSISTLGRRAGLVERRREARGDFAAGSSAIERDALARLDGETDVDGVARAGASSGEKGPNRRCTSASGLWLRTTKAGTCPPPEVTLARPVALRRVRNRDTRRETVRREVDEHVAVDDRGRVADGEDGSRRTSMRSCAIQPPLARRRGSSARPTRLGVSHPSVRRCRRTRRSA
jgi:hypothetical protein